MSVPMVFLIMMFAAFTLSGLRRRRWERWHRMEGGPPMGRYALRPADPELESYVESLETRVARLEERLDFTERLLAGRAGVSPVEGVDHPEN